MIRNINVYYNEETRGAGESVWRDCVDQVKEWQPDRKFKRALEWCAGPGFIGFGLLSHEVCKHITLLDIYTPVKELIDKTIQDNQLEGQVDFIISDNFKQVSPQAKWDLIVANPPHFCVDPYHPMYNDPRRYKDLDWAIHRDFFNTVGQHLTDDGVIVLLEHVTGSGVSTFHDMIVSNGFTYRHALSRNWDRDVWYLEVTRTAK